MEITEVRVYPRSEEKLKAFATVTFDNAFVVRNLKVINGQQGLFVAMPSRKMADGSHKDIAHPINNETRRMIEEKVLAAYQEKIKETSSITTDSNEFKKSSTGTDLDLGDIPASGTEFE